MTDRMILCDLEKLTEGVEMIKHYKESPLVQKAMDDVEKYFAEEAGTYKKNRTGSWR